MESLIGTVAYHFTKSFAESMAEDYGKSAQSAVMKNESFEQMRTEVRREYSRNSDDVDGNFNNPKECLIGIGHCGINICLHIINLINDSNIENVEITHEEKDTENMLRTLSSLFQKKKNNLFSFNKKPSFFLIDLDADDLVKKREELGEKYDHFHSTILDWKEGSGNVQIFGEFHAKNLLQNEPADDLLDWKKMFQCIIDSYSISPNPTKLYFSIFSTGGGTGSGMSQEIGFAQEYIRSERSKELIKSNQAIELTPSPVWRCGVGIMPTIPITEDISQPKTPQHLNTGRLICKYLALLYSQRINKSENRISLSWDNFTLVSNHIIKQGLMHNASKDKKTEIGEDEFFTLANTYVAKLIFNLISSLDKDQIQVKKGFQKLDISDLVANLGGISVVAFNQIPRKNELNLIELFIDSLKPPIVDLTQDLVRGISVLPQKYSKYNNNFQEENDIEKVIENLQGIHVFSKAKSTLLVLRVPKGVDPSAAQIGELKIVFDRLFPNASNKRFSLVESFNEETSITTFIGGSSIILNSECMEQFNSYIQNCFGSKENRNFISKQLELVEKTINDALLGQDIKKQQLFNDIDKLESKLNEKEDVSKFVTGVPFQKLTENAVQTYKHKYSEYVDFKELYLEKETVSMALKELYEIISHELIETLASPFE